METAFDANWLPRLMLTVVTVIYGMALLIADFNKTHVKNPKWTPHARFHVCWQILSYTAYAVLGLVLLWIDFGAYMLQINVAAALIGCVMVAFYISLLTMKWYDGHNYDENGILPAPVVILGKTINFDANITVFSVLTAVLVVAWSLVG